MITGLREKGLEEGQVEFFAVFHHSWDIAGWTGVARNESPLCWDEPEGRLLVAVAAINGFSEALYD